jgi:UDP-glucose 4-epimerase
MRVLLTGGSGYVGRFVAPAIVAAGHTVTHLARRPPSNGAPWLPFDLAAPPASLPAADALVHLAFDHIPDRYRGGEGDDPEGFLRRNRDGSRALVAAAGAPRVVFLSSRAVYGDARRGEILRETDASAPDSLYGEMKVDVEELVFARGGAALRATGVYGRAPGDAAHKWTQVFADFRAGRTIAPRAATEIHGDDLAAAVLALLEAPDPVGPFNASDLLIDRSDLLAAVAKRTGCPHPPPHRAPGPPPGVMATDRLQGLGWRPGGRARLDAFLDCELVNAAE